MKIKTWIKYEESYIPPRCRKPRYKECEEHVSVELPEATMNELQLAFAVNSYEGAVKIYSYNNQLWRIAKMRDICAGGEAKYGYHTPLEALAWWNDHGSKFFRFGSKQDVLEQAQKDMHKYLLVDGILYCCTSEPRYCIYTFGLGHNHGGTALSVDYRYNPNISKDCYFSALQGEEAVAEAKKIALGRGDTESVSRFKAEISVFMPELVTVNPENQHGDGNELLKAFDDITSATPDALTAGLLCMSVLNERGAP